MPSGRGIIIKTRTRGYLDNIRQLIFLAEELDLFKRGSMRSFGKIGRKPGGSGETEEMKHTKFPGDFMVAIDIHYFG